MRALVCAAVPGSSEIFTFAAQVEPPEVRLEKKMSGPRRSVQFVCCSLFG
jgi:hypothetical protein